VLAELGVGRLRRVGVRDVFCTEVAPYPDLLRIHGLDVDGVLAATRELLHAGTSLASAGRAEARPAWTGRSQERHPHRLHGQGSALRPVGDAHGEPRAPPRARAGRVRDGEAVLEVAVGTGLLFADVLRQNPHGRNEGIDLTEAMLDRARAKAERSGATNWQLRVGDAYRLDVADASFDVVVNSYLFDLLPEPDFPTVLGELHRALRPGVASCS